jgi:putative spermidine/putrescine transport system ATP-binding protein
MATVELKSLTKHYGTVSALRNVSLSIAHGEFVALLGPSGCGKTTTLQLVAGFIDPSEGAIEIDGRAMTGVPPHKRNLGVVFQSYALFPHLSVFDNVAFGLKMRNLVGADAAQRVRKALDIVRLSGFEDRIPRRLSGGQQQRVALARALVIEPSVLLLDEPLSNLDANLREQMRFEIREIQRRIGITTVFVTHDQGEAMAAADRLVVMSKGEVRQVGSPRDIYERPSDAFVARFIGQANMLRGKVEATDGAYASIRLIDGTAVVAHAGAGHAVGAAVVLALRHEEIALSERPQPDRNALHATVVRTNFLGATQHAALRVGDREIIVSRPRGETMPEEGTSVTICWPNSVGVLLADSNDGD